MKVLCKNTWKKRIGSILLCWCILIANIQIPAYASAEEHETVQYSEDAGVQTAAEEAASQPETAVPESAPQSETSAPESAVPQPETSAPESAAPQPETAAPESAPQPETSAPESAASQPETAVPDSGAGTEGSADSGLQNPAETVTDTPLIEEIETVTESTPAETEGLIEETESETEERETESETEYQAAQWDAQNGAYVITSVEELQWYGQNGAGQNAYLAEDLQIGSVSKACIDWEPIEISGNAVFDGKDHTIELYLAYSNAEADTAQIGLFAAEDCTIQNLLLKGSLSCSVCQEDNEQEHGYVGAVSPTGSGVTFKNILSYINITNQSTAPTGGITGYLGRSDAREAVIDNCAVYADIRGTGTVGGLIGTGKDQERQGQLTNSIFYGSVSGQDGTTGALVGYSETDNASGIGIDHCYYPENLQGIGGAENQETMNSLTQSSAKSAEQFASGEITSLLNGGITDGSQRWYQTCGSGLPVWEGETVYAHSVGEQIVYTNSATAPETPTESETEEAIQEQETEKTTAAMVKASIDALPEASELEALDEEQQNQIYLEAQDAWDAYEALTEEEQAELTEEKKKLDAILEYFDGRTSVTANTVPYRQVDGSYSYYYGVNGYDLLVAAGTNSGKTTVSYKNGTKTVYLNPSGAAGDDLSNACVYAGNKNDDYTGGNRIVMTGGTVNYLAGMRYGPSSNVYNVMIVRTGGTVNGFMKGAHWPGQKTVYVYLYDTVGSGSVTYLGTDNAGFAGSIRKSGKTWTVTSVSSQIKKAIVPSNVTMTLASDEKLVINEGITLENQGTIENNGAAVTLGSGGKITNTGSGTVKCNTHSYGGSSYKSNGSDGTHSQGCVFNGLHSDNTDVFNTSSKYSCSFDSNGICTACGGYQPAVWNSSKEYYEIENYGQLLWYGAYCYSINGAYKNAVLTNDINIGTSTSYYVDWPKVNCGNDAVIDGQGHTITMYLKSSSYGKTATSEAVGLFCNNYATFQNMILKGEIQCNTTGRVGAVAGDGYQVKCYNIISYVNITNQSSGMTGGLIGQLGQNISNAAWINNCAVYGNISGAGSAGGLVGQGWDQTRYWKLSNSAFYGTVIGAEGKTGALMGYNNTSKNYKSCDIINCYYNADSLPSIGGGYTDIRTNTSVAKTADQFASGEVCWLLNNKNNNGTGIWKQTLNSDPYPTFNGADVYGVEGTVANLYTADSEYIKKVGEYYEIYTANQLIMFQQFVDLGNKSVNGKLMNDIDMNGKTWTPICITGLYYEEKYTSGTNYPDSGYAGIFDGNGNVIRNLSVNGNSGKKETYGLFGTSSGTVKNLGIETFTFDLNGASDIRTGAVVGQNLGGTVSDCYATNVTITPGTYVAGGLVGCNYKGTIKNCHVYNSTIQATANRTGMIVGDNHADGNATDRVGTVQNCYATSCTGSKTIVGTNKTGTVEDSAIKTTDQFASGEVCWLLNEKTDTGVWKQTISTDSYPKFTGSTVYYADDKYFNSKQPALSDGSYQISNVAELIGFAELVNRGETTANGILTADIDMNGIRWKSIRSTDLYYSSTYSGGNYPDSGYAGTFDGNFHVIKNLSVTSVSGEKASYGLFGSLSGTVKNLGIEGFVYTHQASDMRVGAVAGQILSGTVSNCYVTGAVIDPGKNVVGGIAGCNYAGTIENCHVYNSTINAERYGWIVADNRADTAGERVGTIQNCYTDGSKIVGTYTGTETNCQANVGSKFKSGEITYLLNGGRTFTGVWKQTIGKENYPNFVGRKIYQDGSTYKNSEDITPIDGKYYIYNAGQLMAFADLVNAGNNIIGIMMNDIDITGIPDFMIGVEKYPFLGTFDGQGYTLTVNLEGTTYVAPFSHVSACTIQNLIVDGTITASGKFAGGIIGGIAKNVSKTTTLSQCLSRVTITSTVNGDGTHGGLIGLAESAGTITNCGFSGAINGSSTYACAGMVGWANNSVTITDSYVAGSFTLNTSHKDDSSNTFGRNTGKYTLSNCYYLTELKNSLSATQKSPAAFQSGEVTYLLNHKKTDGVWKQTINTETDGTDLSNASDYPVFKGLPVYQMDSSIAKGYVNYEPPKKDSSGVYEIQTADNLMAFAQYVNLGSYDADGKVMADISMAAYAKQWIPIARTKMANETDYGYTGTFDGNGHTISDISFGSTTGQCTNGLFGTVYNGGVVKHVGVNSLTFSDNSYDHRAAGIAGQLMHGGLIEDCFVTDSTIQASSRVVGGIAAMNLGTIQNCYTKGLTLAAHQNRFGGICGDYKGNTYSNNEDGKVINCYTDYEVIGSTAADNVGTMEKSECGIAEARFASGEITYKLNSGREEDKVWYQSLDTDKSPAFEGKTVYYGYRDCGHSEAEYANTELNPTADHCYDTAPEFQWSDDYTTCKAIFTCSVNQEHEKKEVDCVITTDTSDPDKTIYTATVEMQEQSYTDTKTKDNKVVSVTVSWSEIEFDYAAGEWDAANHKYAEGSWSPTRDNGDALTITNNGTVKLDIAASYETAEGSEVEGSVTVKSSEAESSEAEGSDNVESSETESGVAVENSEPVQFQLALGEEQTLSLSLSGELKEKKKHQQVGNIVIRLEESVSDTENVG